MSNSNRRGPRPAAAATTTPAEQAPAPAPAPGAPDAQLEPVTLESVIGVLYGLLEIDPKGSEVTIVPNAGRVRYVDGTRTLRTKHIGEIVVSE